MGSAASVSPGTSGQIYSGGGCNRVHRGHPTSGDSLLGNGAHMESADRAKLVVRLAMEIAARSKQIAMRKKGRKLTQRAIRQWISTGMVRDVHRIISDAFAKAKLLGCPADNTTDHYKSVAGLLLDDWLELHRSAGRPRRHRGLINSTSSLNSAESFEFKKRVGRPTAFPLEEVRGLVAFVEGVRFKALMKKDITNYARVYGYVIYAPPGEAVRELSRAVTDAESIQLFLNGHRDSNLPRDPSKLRAILRNARRKIKIRPPPPKSGG